MLDNELLLKILKQTLSSGGEYADVFVEHRRPTSIQLEDNKIEKIFTGVDSGVGIRLIADGKTYYAFSNDISEKALLELAGGLKALHLASGKSEDKDFTLDLRKQKPNVDYTIKLLPEKIPIDKKIELVRAANKTARDFDKRVRQALVGYRDFVQKVQIAASDGFTAEDERIHTLMVVHIVVSENGIIQTGYEQAGGSIGFELLRAQNRKI